MMAEVNGEQARPGLPVQQKGHRGRTGRISFECFNNGPAQSRRSMQIEKFQQLHRLTAGRFTLCEGCIDERFAFRHSQFETAGWSGVEGLAFEFQQRFLMSRVEYHLLAIPTPPVARNLVSAIEDANGGIGSDERERPPDRLRRDRVIVEIEAYIDGLA
jgi:hypothetical protein